MGVGREMGGCGQCIKYSMFLANFVIFLGGAVVLGVGVWTLLDKAFITELTGTDMFLGAVYILIATGGLVTLIAFLGCMGAVKEIKCMLLTYFLIVFLLFVTMLVGGVLGYVFRENVRKHTDSKMRSTLAEYNSKPNIRRAWDQTQESLHCCGVDGPADWKNRIPSSCCKMGPEGKNPCQTSPTPGNIYSMGCLRTLQGLITDNTNVLAGAGIGVSSLMRPEECQSDYSKAYNQGCLDGAVTFTKNHANIIALAGIIVACLMLLGMIFSCILFKMI